MMSEQEVEFIQSETGNPTRSKYQQIKMEDW